MVGSIHQLCSLWFSRPACGVCQAGSLFQDARRLRRVASFFFWSLACGFWLLLPGCGPTHEQRIADRAITDYFMGDYDRAQKELTPLSTRTNEDFVLNNVRLGS